MRICVHPAGAGHRRARSVPTRGALHDLLNSEAGRMLCMPLSSCTHAGGPRQKRSQPSFESQGVPCLVSR